MQNSTKKYGDAKIAQLRAPRFIERNEDADRKRSCPRAFEVNGYESIRLSDDVLMLITQVENRYSDLQLSYSTVKFLVFGNGSFREYIADRVNFVNWTYIVAP